MNTPPEDKYQKAIDQRQKHVDAILHSNAKKKIVVAGPGTGKTYLFRTVLEGKSKTLTLTFINSLVEDLALELCGLSDVKTLHSFARSALSRTGKEVKVFPKLSEVIKEDARILLGKEIEFDRLFHTRDDGNAHVTFYKRRKDYYDHYGYADIVFAIVKLFEGKREKIPIYEQVVVDEFQDFNQLEVSLIELLAERSPVLIAGDDDQALYDFKDASPEHIRTRHADKRFGYAPFMLPFCSRCTRVIVEAANDVITHAAQNGLLKERLNKPFQYFEDKGKDLDSEQNPKLIYANLFAKQIPWFIHKQLAEIAEKERRDFSVLIISPTKVQSRDIVNALREKGLGGVEPVETRGGTEPTLLDGLKLLLENGNCNLGWRIAAKSVLQREDFEALVHQSNLDGSKTISEIINKDAKRQIKTALKTLRDLRNGTATDENKLDQTLSMLKLDPREMAKSVLRDEILSSAQRAGNPGLRKLRIKATTIQSSKGLAAQYVFITHFDDQYFIKNRDKKNVSDRDICSFLVAMTRAKKRLILVSSNSAKEPTFLKWIDPRRIERFVFEPEGSD